MGALAFAQVVNTISNLLLVPLFLSRWNAGEYGEWMTLSALVAYLGATDFGMNSAAANALLSAYSKRDDQRFHSLQASALAFYITIASAVTLAAAVICALCPVGRWLGATQIPAATAAIVVWLLAGRLMWIMPAGQIWNIYRSTGDLATAQWFNNAQALMLTGITALVLVFHGGVLAVAAWTSLSFLSSATVAWFALSGSHPNLLPRLREANIRDFRALIKPSLWFGVIMVAMALSLNGPTLLVARLFGGAAVALFVTTRTLSGIVRQGVNIICWAIWPELTRFEGTGDYSALKAANRLLTAACLFGSIAVAGALWFEGESVLTTWTGGRLTPDRWLLRASLLYVVCQAPWFASSMVAVATNQNRKLAWSYLAAAVSGMAFIVVLQPWLHLAAVPCGLLVGEALACYHFVVRETCATVHERYVPFAARTWLTLSVAFSIAVSWAWVMHGIAHSPDILRWSAAGVSSALAAGLCVWLLFLQQKERNILVGWLQRSMGLQLRPTPEPETSA
jgi:O-antigen/teichoic acid export membrane protein